MGSQHSRDMELPRKELTMRALPLLMLAMAMLVAGCVTPEQADIPDQPPADDGGDGLDIVAPGGGGGTLTERIDRIAD